LLSLSYSNLFSIQSRFLEQLNPVQQLAFNPEFVSSTAYGFVYSGQSLPLRRDYHFFKGDLEVGGTVQSAFAEAPVGEDVYHRIGGVPVYQFARFETDYRYYWRISEERTWIQRLLLGYVIPYGITNIESASGNLRLPPFIRFFFLGGSNDLRAWPAYRAGGGSSQVTSYRGIPADSNGFSVGTVKALLSSEYRFRIFWQHLRGPVCKWLEISG
jgi:Outer membrane protein/protective antigen OMA87